MTTCLNFLVIFKFKFDKETAKMAYPKNTKHGNATIDPPTIDPPTIDPPTIDPPDN